MSRKHDLASGGARIASPLPLSRAEFEFDILGVELLQLTVHADARGGLLALDAKQGLPFNLKRVFCIFEVPAGAQRAGHAVSSHMLLTSLGGATTVTCDNGLESCDYRLDRRGKALHVMPGVHIRLSRFSRGSVLLVASSQTYDEVRYFEAPAFIKKLAD